MPKPTLGAGVRATVAINSSKELKGQLSTAGKLVLWAGMQSFEKIASGDLSLGGGIAAASVIAGAAYVAGKMLIEEVTTSITMTAKQVVSGVDSMVPLIGGWLETVIAVATAPKLTEQQVVNDCIRGYSHVGGRDGSGPNGEILPADLFMAEWTSDKFPRREPEGDEPPWEESSSFKSGRGGGTFADLLRLLEEPPPTDVWAQRAWPGAGLSAKVRDALRDLRLGMSAAYVRQDPRTYGKYANRVYSLDPSTKKGRTDGGATLWPLYADLLTSSWRAGRLPRDWLRWRLLAADSAYDGESYANRHLAVQYARVAGDPTVAKLLGLDPIKNTREIVLSGKNKGGASGCVLWDERALDQFESLVRGWYQYVDPNYSQFAFGNLAPMLETGEGLPVITYAAANQPRTTFPMPHASSFSWQTAALGAAGGFLWEYVLKRQG